MDTYITNCKVYTMDRKDTVCSVVGIKDGKFAWLGDALPVDTGKAEVIDLSGSTVLPAFTDSHLHLMNYAYLKTVLRLFGVTSIREAVSLGRQRMSEAPPKESQWLFGRGWNQELFQEGRMLTRKDLDQISDKVPVFLVRVCGHIAVLNTPAMKLLLEASDVDSYMENIDEESGLIRAAAIHYCYTIMPSFDKETVKALIRKAQADLLAKGIAAVGSDDFISLPGQNRQVIYETYCEMDKAGQLLIRIQEQCAVVEPKDLDWFLEFNRNFLPSDHLKMDVIKIVLDGSLGARTALFKAPYADDPSTCGFHAYTTEELDSMVALAHKNGYQVAIHAIGDKGCQMVADAYVKALEEWPRDDHRHGIVHFQVADEEVLRKVRDNGIIGYVQPVFLSSDMAMLDERLGERRSMLACNWKSMKDMGIPISGGSDAPVESFNILENIWCAITRRKLGSHDKTVHNPAQRLSRKEAVGLFTCDGPYMSFEEEKRGTVEIGKLADLVVLSDDIFQVEEDQIPKLSVVATMVDGKILFHC